MLSVWDSVAQSQMESGGFDYCLMTLHHLHMSYQHYLTMDHFILFHDSMYFSVCLKFMGVFSPRRWFAVVLEWLQLSETNSVCVLHTYLATKDDPYCDSSRPLAQVASNVWRYSGLGWLLSKLAKLCAVWVPGKSNAWMNLDRLQVMGWPNKVNSHVYCSFPVT